MNHPSPEALLDLALDLLPPSEAEGLRRHVEECPRCAAACARLAEEQEVLREGLAPHTPPPELVGRVRSAVARERARPRPTRRAQWLAAAVVLIAAGMGWVLLGARPTPKQQLLMQVRRSELLALQEERP
ncbi:MAG: hypothetical protein D6731_13985 [Planctomycetota bacterium]|nr:MAG: hypothetical protein D6731_13985 [Planctomycetota bacterium]